MNSGSSQTLSVIFTPTDTVSYVPVTANVSINVLKKSLMPENVAELLTVKELHDLFAFLMTLE